MSTADVRTPAPTTKSIVPAGAHPTTSGQLVTQTAPNAAGNAALTPTATDEGGGVVSGAVRVIGGTISVTAGTDRNATGSIPSAGGGAGNIAINSQECSLVLLQIAGTWTGTVLFEGLDPDGTTWSSVVGIVPTTGAEVTSATASGLWGIACAAYQQIRARGNTVATGSATIGLAASSAMQNVAIGLPLPTGTNTIGAVTAPGAAALALDATAAAGNTSLAAILVDTAAILAKQPSAPALETGHLATIDTSTATTATQTTTTATNTGTLAGVVSGGKALVTETSAAAILAKLVAAPALDATVAAIVAAVAAQNAALPASVVVEGGVGKDAAPSQVTDGNTARRWLSRVGGAWTHLADAAGAALFPSATAPVDGESASATITRIGARLWGYSPNGNFSVLRSGQVVPGAVIGWLNTLVGAVYNASPTTRTEAQGGPLQADANGNLNTNAGTLGAGEDQSGVGTGTIQGVMAVAGEASFTNISTATTTTVKSGAGLLAGVCVNGLTATGTITAYDSLTASGTKIGTVAVPVPGATYFQGIKFATGLTIVTGSAASDLTVAYR